MKNSPFLFFRFWLVITLVFAGQLATHAKEEWRWHDARSLTLEGKGWTATKDYYDRLPAYAEKLVRPPVWNLSQDSAGMGLRFVTDSPVIAVRWILRKDALDMPHMPASGVSGVDLYGKEQGRWQWVGAARPKQVTNEVVVARGLPEQEREFMLYLPLYNGVHSVEIGVLPKSKLVAAARRQGVKPIVFYGTSILQGGCASRPGLAHASILGRQLDWPTINLGFSGNACSEPELAQLLAELDPALYVLEPLPNMKLEMVRERMEPFLQTLRKKHPRTPIVLVENLLYPDGRLLASRRESVVQKNAALREIFERLKKSDKHLHYLSSQNLLDKAGEGTVDGTHPNDLGFMHMAHGFAPVLRKLLPTAR